MPNTFRKIIISFLLLLIQLVLPAQKKTFDKGDRVNISVDLYSAKDASLSVVIPENKYTLLYQYNHTGKETDTNDSLKKLEDIISLLIKKYKISELRVLCCSFDKGNDYKLWLQTINKKKPLKDINSAEYEYYNTNEFVGVAKTIKKLFEKVTFIAPEGKLLAESNSVSNFNREAEALPGISNKKLKAKLLTDSSGSRIPLIKTIVCFVNEMKADTFSQTRTDEYGNFEMFVPEKENSNYDLSVKKNDRDKPESVILAAQNGIEIATFIKTKYGFKYKLLQADIHRLEEIEEKDITLSFNNFKGSTETKLKVIEQIVYASGKFNVGSESEVILDKVAKILKENPNIRLEVISHTDSNGDDKQNMNLSIKRSEAVIAYLVSKGVDKKRLTGIGKGESMIRNRCTNGIECDDKEHEYNRRTEFNFTKGN